MMRKLSRRHVLRGAGVALALPWLEAMRSSGSAFAQDATRAKRYMPIYMPNGATTLWWRTTGAGAGDAWQLSPLLSPFEAVKQKMLMIRQMGNFTWRRDLLTMNPRWNDYRERNDFCGVCRMPVGAFILPSHSRDPSAILNCTDGDAYRREHNQDVGSSPANAETVDQLIARSITDDTPIKSMQLGVLNGNGGLDDRHSAMSRNMSWNQEGTSLGKDTDPADVFDKLAATGAGQDEMDAEAIAAAERRRALDLSALDSIGDSTVQLQQRLGQSDRARLEDFLTGVRELEVKTRDMTQVEGECNATVVPGDVSDPTVRFHAMNDLIVMALACDVTRVITYMLENSRSDTVYSWVPRRDFENGGVEVGGTATSYHGSQHHAGISPDFASITRWHIEGVADLLQKMDAIEEPSGGTLLDNSLVMFMSAMHHGDHAAFDLPLLLFGSGSGVFRQNELISLPEGIEDIRQLRDLHFTVLNNYFNLGVDSFGDDMRDIPNQPLTEILA